MAPAGVTKKKGNHVPAVLRSIRVRKFGPDVTSAQLLAHFSKFGPVSKNSVKVTQVNNEPIIASLTFKDAAAAEKAISSKDKLEGAPFMKVVPCVVSQKQARGFAGPRNCLTILQHPGSASRRSLMKHFSKFGDVKSISMGSFAKKEGKKVNLKKVKKDKKAKKPSLSEEGSASAEELQAVREAKAKQRLLRRRKELATASYNAALRRKANAVARRAVLDKRAGAIKAKYAKLEKATEKRLSAMTPEKRAALTKEKAKDDCKALARRTKALMKSRRIAMKTKAPYSVMPQNSKQEYLFSQIARVKAAKEVPLSLEETKRDLMRVAREISGDVKLPSKEQPIVVTFKKGSSQRAALKKQIQSFGAKKLIVGEVHPKNVVKDAADLSEARTLSVTGRFGPQVTGKDLATFFSRFGRVENVSYTAAEKDKDSKAFVTFAEYPAADRAAKVSVINGTPVYSTFVSSDRSQYKPRKLYVTGIPEKATSKQVEKVFSRYGRVASVHVNKCAGQPTGLALVTFKGVRAAEKARKNAYKMGDNQLTVRRLFNADKYNEIKNSFSQVIVRLPESKSALEIKTAFAKFGSVSAVQLGKKQKIARVTFRKPSDAKKACLSSVLLGADRVRAMMYDPVKRVIRFDPLMKKSQTPADVSKTVLLKDLVEKKSEGSAPVDSRPALKKASGYFSQFGKVMNIRESRRVSRRHAAEATVTFATRRAAAAAASAESKEYKTERIAPSFSKRTITSRRIEALEKKVEAKRLRRAKKDSAKNRRLAKKSKAGDRKAKKPKSGKKTAKTVTTQ